MWENVQRNLPGAIDLFNQSSQIVEDIAEQEKAMAAKRDKGSKWLLQPAIIRLITTLLTCVTD
jgi:hypothetical protein